MSKRPDHQAAASPSVELDQQDENHMVGSLVAGPVTWGLIGAGLDALLDTGRLCLALGIVIGFMTSIYIVYVRYGR